MRYEYANFIKNDIGKIHQMERLSGELCWRKRRRWGGPGGKTQGEGLSSWEYVFAYSPHCFDRYCRCSNPFAVVPL